MLKTTILSKQFCARLAVLLALAIQLSGCGASLPADQRASKHISQDSVPDPASQTRQSSDIPDIVSQVPLVTPPSVVPEPLLYSITVMDRPLREVLFGLARDAGINLDFHPDVEGLITLNAIDQSLPRIIERISRQSDIRWYFDEAGNLVVEPDRPYWKNYRVDYVNVSRSGGTESSTSTSIVTAVAGANSSDSGSGTNNSTSTISQTFNNDFWGSLQRNLTSIVGESNSDTSNSSVVSNPESGVISVNTTGKQHEQVNAFINMVSRRSSTQVLIEATIVEVDLSDDYQSGVDWSILDRNNGQISFEQVLPSFADNANPTNVLKIDRSNTPDAISSTISLLSVFGEMRVLSSPKIMALNNQSALLRVVENEVFFTVDVEPAVISSNGIGTEAVFTTTVNTVPVGFVMNVTPQISDNGQVSLIVRPTISRIQDYALDPNPSLAKEGAESRIPIMQVREFESILNLQDGQVAILGGLMQDTVTESTEGMPGLSRLPMLRNLFSQRRETSQKSELIIFIRPVVVKQPTLDGDLSDYRSYLPSRNFESSALLSPGSLPGIK